MLRVIHKRSVKFKMKKIWKFIKDEQGATAVEYAIIAAAIAGVIVAVVTVVGQKTDNNFKSVNSGW